jgi:hypothetical protein
VAALLADSSLLVIGEPGSGKTFLAQTVIEELRDRGFLVATPRIGTVKQILMDIATDLGVDTETLEGKTMTAQQLRDAIAEWLEENNAFLVLDDVHRFPASMRYWLEQLHIQEQPMITSQKSKVKSQNYFWRFSFALTIMAARMFINSLISFNKESSLLSGTISEAINNLSQYLVSLASFKAISNLWIKSAVLCAALDSWTLAPIEVPERINCLDKSRLTPGFSLRKLQSLTTRRENSKVRSQISKGLSGITNPRCARS